MRIPGGLRACVSKRLRSGKLQFDVYVPYPEDPAEVRKRPFACILCPGVMTGWVSVDLRSGKLGILHCAGMREKVTGFKFELELELGGPRPAA